MATILAFRTLCLSLLWISFLSVIVVLHLSRQELKTPAMEGIKRIASYLGPKEEPPILAEVRNTSKYIMYQCQGRDLCGGLADRFKMVINAYAWSLFTNRKLIIDISKPCNFINLMVPNEVDWNLNITQLVENGDLPKKYKHFIIGKMDNGGFKNDLSKIDLFSYKEEADILTLHSNLEWISGYVRNGFLIDAGFITPDMLHFSRAFNKWFNKIFNLNPKVEEKFQEYLKKAKPTNTSKLICTQVRIGGSRPNVSYDQSITPRNFTVFYWDFIKNTFIKNMTDEKFDDYKIFVTGDTKSAVDEAREALGADRVLTIDGHYPHMDREFNYKDNCKRFEKVVMDFYMLGYCDMALVSDSGFGIFGLLRNRIPERDFYVLSALMRTGKSKHTILPLKRFLYLNPHRY